MKRVLLAGATGYIGLAVARELLRNHYEVVAIVRDSAAELPGCEVLQADMSNATNLQQCLADVSTDAVISCIASRTGTPADAQRVDYAANRNLLASATTIGASHFILLSAICVQRPRLAFQKYKLAFEEELRNSGLDFTIVRPTAFFKSLSGQVERLQAGKPFLLFGDGTQTACKPISATDLAAFIIDCLHNDAARNQVLPIGGPGAAITPREQGELLFELLGRTPRFRQVPPGLLAFVAAVLSPAGRFLPRVAEKAELARIGHYYATESMLVWDSQHGRYDAEATPETGGDTLRDHYAHVLRDGITGHELREHRLF